MTYRGRQGGEQFEAMEIVHDGWLVKSPPEKRILKAKWRQRWFVLRSSGQLPGQFVLEYYTDTTRRKLKGKIDLDQCEQVDAGLTVECRKSSYQHIFDIRTPKRIYYLVAETESDMNKWVECICSVCGLKIHVEEDYVPPQEPSPSIPVPPISKPPEQSTANMELLRSGSNPYISISECISGQPIANGFVNGRGSCSESLPEEAPPPPPKTGSLDKSSDFYDYPKPLNILNDKNRTSPEPNIEDLYKIPPPIKKVNCVFRDDDSLLPPLPPKVNWDTYPQECLQSKTETESQSKDMDCIVTKEYCIDDICKVSEALADQLEHSSINDLSSVDLPDFSASEDSNKCSENSEQHHLSANIVNTIKPPPRPPKPHNLGRKYENVTLVSSSDTPLYDTPSGKGVALSKYLPAEVFSFLKDDTDLESLSPSTKVPPPLPKSSKDVALDDIYDFPKLRSEDNINMSVPLMQNGTGSQRRKRHAYTNAPPGLFSNKDTIFNYEFVRPGLLSGDGYLTMDLQKSELYTDMSGEARLSPSALGTYANVPASPSLALGPATDIPPAVNRELKPKRKVSDADSAQNGAIALAPPPVSRFRPHTTKRSFRKPSRPTPTERTNTNTPPPLPGRGRQRSEHSASDDDLASSGGSRRNSVNSEQEMKQMIPPAPLMKKEEIQYLDLDLDSDASVQSPRSPERLSSASIVYKKIDFVKTKAFNEMRQNVEETYRKSQ